MSNTYNALIHAKQDGTGEEVANNKTGEDGSLYAPVTSIATPENGDTASKAYAVGEMFIRGGKLCTCIVAISSGDALVKDTNYKEGDVGEVLTELNSNLSGFGKTITNGSADMEKYNVFIVQLQDNWVSGIPIISATFTKTMSIAFPYVAQNEGTAAVGYFRLEYDSNTKKIVVVDSWCTVNSSSTPTITNIVGVC